MTEKRAPINLQLNIEPGIVERLAEEGRLADFVSAFPALAAGHLKAKIVESLAQGGAVGFHAGYFIEDDDFGNGPWGPLTFLDSDALASTSWGLRRHVHEVIRRVG